MANRKPKSKAIPLGMLSMPANSDPNDVYTDLVAAQQDVVLLRQDLVAAEEREHRALADTEEAGQERDAAEARADKAETALEESQERVEALESLLESLGLTTLQLNMLAGTDRGSIEHDARAAGLLGVVL